MARRLKWWDLLTLLWIIGAMLKSSGGFVAENQDRSGATSHGVGQSAKGQPPRNETSRGVQVALWAVIGVGVVLIGLFAASQITSPRAIFASAAPVVATSGMLALAAGAVGAFAGFLFGVPRLSTAEEQALQEAPAASSSPVRFLYNTSLSQISDWLTKILVGVGLIQLRELPGALTRLAAGLSPALGGGAAAGTFGTALLSAFLFSGLLMGYIMTALYFKRELEDIYLSKEREGAD